MYPAVPADEIAFAMTLFVGSANGQGPHPSAALQTQDPSCEKLFLVLSFGTRIAPDPMRRAALLASSIYRAFCALWDSYAGDERREAICARVLGFCFLMERRRSDILALWQAPATDKESIALHPAVVVTVAVVPLGENGLLSESAFLEHLSETAEQYPDLRGRAPANARQHNDSASVGSSWPAGESATAGLMRRKDWSATTAGDAADWPQSLRTAIELALACGFPMIVLWGPELIQFYNDAYRDLMGSKHPAGLGQPTRECWPEVWSINQPVYAKVLAGESITFEDQLFPIVRYGYLEDAYFTLCYSPLRDEAGTITGVLVTVFETTLRARARLQRVDEVHAHGTNGDSPVRRPRSVS